MPIDFHRHSRRVQELLDSSTPFVVVTMVSARGSAPQVVGAKAIMTGDGVIEGTVGGGKVEAAAIDHAQSLLQPDVGKSCELVTWNLQTDIGMTCGGEVQFVFEVANRHAWKIAIFGAGHVAQFLLPLLLQLPCSITCLDSRPLWLGKLPQHPRLSLICSDGLKDQVSRLDPKSFFVLMTQGHATDLPILAEILANTEARYVGVIGSVQKAKILHRELRQFEIPEERRRSFYCPIGLPLGTNTPAEISISIIAQLIQERDRLGVMEHKSKAF